MKEGEPYRLAYEARDGLHCLVLKGTGSSRPIAEFFPVNAGMERAIPEFAERVALSYNAMLGATLPRLREHDREREDIAQQYALAVLALAQWDTVFDAAAEMFGVQGTTIGERATAVLELLGKLKVQHAG